jgi:6-phosphogluconolactonase
MALSADRKRIYVLSEEGSKGMVSVYRIDQQRGMLELINQQWTVGGGPCYVSEHAATGTVYVSNYGGGSLTVFKTDANGALLPHAQHIVYTGSSVNKNRQEKPHAHCAVIDPKGKFVYVNDLGTDQIHRHTIAFDGMFQWIQEMVHVIW